ncbi:1-phosphofructokinase [Aureibacillus halotolerans]|uniref:Tagatose-6-phosphate kinase n=1 Tax=Aureibacillus halotolerans TaxID=1508390 RepID=A0A4R6UAK3_9BACI|nr:1-phosphofructokinase [Aureibacillus halotolerans]TDQ42886.1 fructose-1-phosphate kinase [Aureibacillus halotolerans]
MIYTVTLNPALDYVVHIDSFNEGSVIKSTNSYTSAGGKGINVSRVLKTLGSPSKALGFVGGFTGKAIVDAMAKEQIEADFEQLEGETRINVKLKSGQETEINGVSPDITDANFTNFQKKLEQINENDTVVLAGSVPATLPETVYATLTKLIHNRGAHVFLDTSGAGLREGLKAAPDFIKPNHQELGELYDTSVDSISDAVRLAKRIQTDFGVTHILISMAGDGALYVSGKKVIHAHAPKGTVINSVGAGDSFTAGFIHQFKKHDTVEDALKLAISTGSATAFSAGLCDRETVEALVPTIELQGLNEEGIS